MPGRLAQTKLRIKTLPGVRPALRLGQDIRQIRNFRQQVASYGIGFHNWWPQGSVPESWFYRFLQRPALRSYAARRRLGFFSVYGRRRLLPLSGCDRRIFFTGEALSRYPAYFDRLRGQVDLRMGFDEDAAADYLRFPIWLLECFEPLATEADIERQLTDRTRPNGYPTESSKFAVLVASHDRGSVRALSPYRVSAASTIYGYYRRLEERLRELLH